MISSAFFSIIVYNVKNIVFFKFDIFLQSKWLYQHKIELYLMSRIIL